MGALKRGWGVRIGLALWVLVVCAGVGRRSFSEIAWPDECIYLVGARNLIDNANLNTHFYLTTSLIARGYPHRDVHLPGYVFALTPFVKLLGATLTAGVALNVLCLLAWTLLLYELGLRLLGNPVEAAVAAALLPILPPIPGYLSVVYPEYLVGVAFLVPVTWLTMGRSQTHAVVAGILLSLSLLVRESGLLVLPVFLAVLPWRRFWRGFLPGFAVCSAIVLPVFSRNRAIHPNALFPSVIEESLRTEHPVAHLWATVFENIRENLMMAARARPLANAEDAVLGFIALLILLCLASLLVCRPGGRDWTRGVVVSLALLTAAVFSVYVVRVKGGVWGGVRAYMPWVPLLLLLSVPLWSRIKPVGLRAAVLALAVSGFVCLDLWHIAFFGEYKASDLAMQRRKDAYLARYVDAHAPHRVLGASFTYGLTRYPVEVIWKLPRSEEQLAALENTLAFEYVVVDSQAGLASLLQGRSRYFLVNRDDPKAEFRIWRRIY